MNLNGSSVSLCVFLKLLYKLHGTWPGELICDASEVWILSRDVCQVGATVPKRWIDPSTCGILVGKLISRGYTYSRQESPGNYNRSFGSIDAYSLNAIDLFPEIDLTRDLHPNPVFKCHTLLLSF